MTAADPCLNGHRPVASEAEATDDQPAATILESLGPLAGLPGEARFRPVVGKSPSMEEWNSDPSLWLTAQQVLKERALGGRWTGIGLLTGSKVGRLCWLDFDGEEIDPDTGVVLRSASLDFETLFNMPVADLPPSPINVSGRPGRFRALFRVPAEWVDYFRGFSIVSGESPTKSFEFLYEKAGGKLFHAVVEGQHPDGQGWQYRWRDGCSPAEVEIPDLPARVIAGLVRHIAKKAWSQIEKLQAAEERGLTVGGETGPMDLLSPGQQRRLIRKMEAYWPYRGGEAEGLGSKGHYDVMRRLVLSLWKGIADESTFKLWLVDSDWDLKNDWSGERGSNPVNGGELLSWAKSLAKSDTQAEEVKPWAAAWQIAVENGWKPPKWALPPRQIDSHTLQVDTKKKVEELKKAMAIIDEMDTPLDREMAYQNLKQNLGFRDKEMLSVVKHLNDEAEGVEGGYLDDVVAQAKTIEVAVERFLPFGAVTMLGADPGTGKSVFIYRIAEAAAYGGLFAGQLRCQQGNVLVVQRDESDANLKQKQKLMGWKDPERRILVKFRFSPGHFPELVKWIREHKARYVVMDSFASLFAGGADLAESDAGIYLYKLNSIAAAENCAILLTHHLRKSAGGGNRTDVSLSDFYGSTFISAGTSDAWGLFKDPEARDEEVSFFLKNVKPRSGIAQQGDRFRLAGSVEDLSLHVEEMNGVVNGVENLRDGELKLLRVLRTATEENPLLAVSPDANDQNDLMRKTGLSKAGVYRLLGALMERPELRVRRKRIGGGKGRAPYWYWAEGATTEI